MTCSFLQLDLHILSIYDIVNSSYFDGGDVMKLMRLTEEEFDSFSKNHAGHSIYQTSHYGELMKKRGFDVFYVGFLNHQETLVGASLILSSPAVLSYRKAYIPLGVLTDYTNQDLVHDITMELRKFMIHHHIIFFKMNPPIICSKRDKEGKILSYHPEINHILNILEDVSFQHLGFSNFFENEIARWHGLLNLHTSNERLFFQFSKPVRNKIRKADKLGIVVEKVEQEQLKVFYEFIKRKSPHSFSYYQHLFTSFGSKAELYLAKIDAFKYVQKSKEAYEQVNEENEKLQMKMQSATTRGKDMHRIIKRKMESDKILGMEQASLNRSTRMFQTNPEGIIIGGAIVIKEGNTVHLIIDGYNKKYAKFNSNYFLRWEMIQRFNLEGFEYFDFGDMVGELKEKNKYSGLNDAKFGFGAILQEYLGEFLYVVNPAMFQVYSKKKRKKKDYFNL